MNFEGLWIIICLLSLSSCATPHKVAEKTIYPPMSHFNSGARTDQIWKAIASFASTNGTITLSDKESGLLNKRIFFPGEGYIEERFTLEAKPASGFLPGYSSLWVYCDVFPSASIYENLYDLQQRSLILSAQNDFLFFETELKDRQIPFFKDATENGVVYSTGPVAAQTPAQSGNISR